MNKFLFFALLLAMSISQAFALQQGGANSGGGGQGAIGFGSIIDCSALGVEVENHFVQCEERAGCLLEDLENVCKQQSDI